MKYPFSRRALGLLTKVGKARMSTRFLYAIFASVFVIDILMLASQFAHAGLLLNLDSLLLIILLIIHFLLVYWSVKTVRSSIRSVEEGEEKFRRIFSTSPVAISISTVDEGRIVDANKAYWKLIDFEPSLGMMRTTAELGIVRPDFDRARFVERLKAHRSLNNPAYQFTTRSGQNRVTMAFYELISLEHEPVILSMFYDVTSERDFQAALQASEEKYRNFVERSMEGIWLLGFDQPISLQLSPEEQTRLIYEYGYIAECNDVLAHMYGYESSVEIRGVRLLNVQEGEVLNEMNYQATLTLVKDNYRSANRETVEKTRDGKTVYFLNNAVGVFKDDYLVGLWGTQLDITALKNAEAALRHSEARIRALLNAIPDLIFELNREGIILQFIPSAVNDPLLPPEQFLGKPIREVIPWVADQTLFSVARSLESGLVSAFEYDIEQKGEMRTFEARISPLTSDTVLAIVRDVSLRHWAETERSKLIDELEAKNAELERFTYTVSHDLKSPLITIRGFLGFLKEDSRSGNVARLDADIQRISDATEKMQTLLNDLLELSRVGRLINKPEEVSFRDVVDEALELVHGRISQRGIAVSVSDDLSPVYVDHPRLVEVMQNLLDNAAKFMGDQISPRIEIGQNGFKDEMPLFYVRDNGIGIPHEFMDNIFGLFNKLDARSEGTGVGLALVKRIIEFHQGKIWAESEPGKGATFYFTLPTLTQPHR